MSAKRAEPSGGFAPVFAAARGGAPKVPKASGWSVATGTADGTCMVRTDPGCVPSAKVAAFDMVRGRTRRQQSPGTVSAAHKPAPSHAGCCCQPHSLCPHMHVSAAAQDGTLVVHRGSFAKDAHDWTWFNPHVVPRLKALHASGYRLVVFR